MKTISQVIEESRALAEKLKSESAGSGISSVSFDFYNYPVEDVKAAAIHTGRDAEYLKYAERFGYCVSPVPGVYIHIYSVKVKVREVIETD